MSPKEKTLITVVGPTAIGKTALAIELAKFYSTEIISCDSRQFYKEMNIGTAIPSNTELEQVKHHFIHSRSILDSYDVGQFEQDAIFMLNHLFEKRNIVIMVGGSGLYVDAVLKGFDDFPKVDNQVREKLIKQLENDGISKLQERLKELDVKSYNEIALDNPQRLIRALEICIGTGKPYSSFIKKQSNKRDFTSIMIGLTAERNLIYDRINNRVDKMIEEGLVDEAKTLYKYRELNALQTVGYRELFDYFDGTFDYEFAIAEIKKNTRRFAKRQLTWFRRYENIDWFDYMTPVKRIIETINSKL